LWKDWKRAQVTDLLGELAVKARRLNPGIQVTVTGCTPYHKAWERLFQDWTAWLSYPRVDYVTAMTYAADPKDYKRQVDDVLSHVADRGRVAIAVGAYQLGASPDAFSAEMDICESSGAGACVLFHYGSLLDAPALKDKLLLRK
jgi:uncharacterized lipoprotein YddW (UPF0748 family)